MDDCGSVCAVSKSSHLAEQLWNIANPMMITGVAPDEKKYTTCFIIAGYLIDAHDFALLSEEEAGTMLTKRDRGTCFIICLR